MSRRDGMEYGLWLPAGGAGELVDVSRGVVRCVILTLLKVCPRSPSVHQVPCRNSLSSSLSVAGWSHSPSWLFTLLTSSSGWGCLWSGVCST